MSETPHEDRRLFVRLGAPIKPRQKRDAARKTVTEFVQKWLVTQREWQEARQPTVEVVFAE